VTFANYFRQFIREHSLNDERVFTVDDLYGWFDQRYPPPIVLRKNVLPQLLKKTTNHPDRLVSGKYDPDATSVDDFFFCTDVPVFTKFRVYRQDLDDRPYYPSTITHERELQKILAQNPELIEQGLSLIEANSRAGSRCIDLLCLDREHNLVVIELKVSRASDRVIGQLLFYMGWLKNHRAEAEQSVRGIILGNKIAPALRVAASVVPNVQCLEFDKCSFQRTAGPAVRR
jgi:endonuclease